MQKIVLLLSCLLNANVVLANYPVNYNCEPFDWDYPSIELQVIDADNFLINQQDPAGIDTSYQPEPQNQLFSRLSGYFPSIGDGVEGYNVTVLINKYVRDGADWGLMKYRASGADGFYSYGLKCLKQ